MLAPPRWVDPDVATAVRVIESTSNSLATRPIGLDDAVGGQLLPNGRSHLASVPASARTLPTANVDTVQQANQTLPALTAVFTPPRRPTTIDPQAAAVLAEIPLEAQRVAASAWGRPGFAASASAFGQRLLDRLDYLTHGVQIVARPGSSYTLTSDNSPFPLTVRNTLPWPVTIRANLTTARGLAGFRATSRTESVGANQKASFKLATNVTRRGYIQVIASLSTPAPDSQPIGDSVELTVRSTALGLIGVIITVGAGAVLVLALIIRFGRRLRHRLGAPPKRPRFDPDATYPEAGQPAPSFAATMREREDIRATPADSGTSPAAERRP